MVDYGGLFWDDVVSDHEFPEHDHRWPLTAELVELTGRWRIDPERDLRHRTPSPA